MGHATTAKKPVLREVPAEPAQIWSELQFRRLLEKLPAGAYLCDSQGLITFYNERAAEQALLDADRSKDEFLVVRRLVEMHGGTVEVASPGLGQGNVFTVKLPIEDDPEGDRAKPPGEGAAPAPPLRILVVDDNRDSADSLGMLFRLLGHDVRTAHDGLQAVAAAEEFRPDAMVLDIGLPKLDGYEVARQLRSQPWGGKMVLIAVTGWGQDEDKERSKEAGFDHHLVKPVDPTALIRLLAGGG